MDRKLTALVIGNADYPGGAKLKNPKNDADDLSERLERCGFSVIKKIDCTNKELDVALKAFKKNLKGNDVGLFFFAGHGMQIDGDNYLNAVDTDFSDETDAKYSSLALNKVIELMEKSGTSTNIIILDACRNNPFERAWNRSSALRGLAPIYAPKGTLIAFATSPGEVASDGRGKNGAYTEALLRHIDTPDSSIEEMFKRVRNTLSTIKYRFPVRVSSSKQKSTMLLGDNNAIGYVTRGNDLVAFDTDTAKELWRWKSDNTDIYACAALKGDAVIVGEGKAFAVIRSGKLEDHRDADFMLFVMKFLPNNAP